MLGRDGGDDIASTVPKQNVLFTAFTLTSNVSPHRDVMLDVVFRRLGLGIGCSHYPQIEYLCVNHCSLVAMLTNRSRLLLNGLMANSCALRKICGSFY
jgi:hypothetical protein